MIRKARPADVAAIYALINANTDQLLPRSEEELKSMVDMFWVAETQGEVVGCVCLEVYSPKIAEVRSLAVRKDCQGGGYGRRLVDAAVEEAVRQNIPEVMVITSNREYFEKQNFGVSRWGKYALFFQGPVQK